MTNTAQPYNGSGKHEAYSADSFCCPDSSLAVSLKYRWPLRRFCRGGRSWMRHCCVKSRSSLRRFCGTVRRRLRRLCGKASSKPAASVVDQLLTNVRGQASVRNNDGITMIVRYEQRVVRRTCGSVRSSLSALAWLATAGSEAAETTSFHRPDEESSVMRIPRLPASMRSEGQAE